MKRCPTQKGYFDRCGLLRGASIIHYLTRRQMLLSTFHDCGYLVAEDFNSTRSSEPRVHAARERRVSARIDAPYPMRVSSVDSEGQKFKEDALLENLSGGGLYVRLRRKLVVGLSVSVAVRLSTVPARELPAVRLAARGIVSRVEPAHVDGRCGTAIEFQHRRIL